MTDARLFNRDGDELWTTTQVAAFLGLRVGTISTMRHRALMPRPAITLGLRTHLWNAETVRMWQRKRAAGWEVTPKRGRPPHNSHAA